MWHTVIINVCLSLPVVVKCAWVEIPQITSDKPAQPPVKNKPAQFVFGAPKVAFVDQKFTTTETTTPKLPATTLATYKHVMTSTTATPLTTTAKPPEVERRHDEQPPEIRLHPEPNPKNQTEKTENFGFLPLLKNIQETLTQNAKKSLKSKISLLTDLRDNLLVNIDERMSNLWKRNEDTLEARGHDDEMDFPSNEGALMTIGFLTFAVFLIKLVLKLIHALKYKHHGNTVMVTTMAPAAAFIGRKKRDLENLKILQLIDEYKFT